MTITFESGEEDYMIDFLVPLTRPHIPISELIEDSQTVLGDLLRLKIPPTLRMETIKEGKPVTNRFEALEANDEGICLNISLLDIAKTQIFMFHAIWEGKNAPTASISPYGLGRTHGGLVLSAACAIAIAQKNESFIEDSACVWGGAIRRNPKQLFLEMQSSIEQVDVRKAMQEICEKMGF